MEQNLHLAKAFLDFYFSPWGAAKAAQWEMMTNDRSFTPAVAVVMCESILAGNPITIRRIKEIFDASS